MIDIELVAARLLNAVELYGSLRISQIQNRLQSWISRPENAVNHGGLWVGTAGRDIVHINPTLKKGRH